MKFTSNWPTVNGYYWFVDTDYPVPQIGFIQGDGLYHGENRYPKQSAEPDRKYGLKIGDPIIPPACTDVEIV